MNGAGEFTTGLPRLAEIESLAVQAVRKHLEALSKPNHAMARKDRDLIERHVERIVVKPTVVEVRLCEPSGPATADDHDASKARDRNDAPPVIAPAIGLPSPPATAACQWKCRPAQIDD